LPARRWGFAAPIIVALLALVAGAGVLTANSNRDRTISFYGVNTKETLTIQYMKNGKHIPEAMEKINWMLRDWRKDEPTQMDPDLIDLVWEIHNELGSAEPINVISAYRSRDTNELLRRTVGGQASQSRHILGKAMDVTFPDVPVKKLRYSALIRERGGVGYYPTSATPFVHIDTDRVRAWPRATRTELALLFPNGRTQHVPDDGGPITPEDVRRARAGNSEIAQQIAEFHQQRAHPKAPIQVAEQIFAADRAAGLPRRPGRERAPVRAVRGHRGRQPRVALGDPEVADHRIREAGNLLDLLDPRLHAASVGDPAAREITRLGARAELWRGALVAVTTALIAHMDRAGLVHLELLRGKRASSCRREIRAGSQPIRWSDCNDSPPPSQRLRRLDCSVLEQRPVSAMLA